MTSLHDIVCPSIGWLSVVFAVLEVAGQTPAIYTLLVKSVVNQHGKGNRWLSDDGKWTCMFIRMYTVVIYWPVVSVDGKLVVEDESGKITWHYKTTPVDDLEGKLAEAVAACGSIEFLQSKGVSLRSGDSPRDNQGAASDAVAGEPVNGSPSILFMDVRQTLSQGNLTTAATEPVMANQPTEPSPETRQESPVINTSEPLTQAPVTQPYPTTRQQGLLLDVPWQDMASNKPGESISGLTGPSFEAGRVGEEATARQLDAIISAITVGTGTKAFALHSLPLTDRMDVDHVFTFRGGVLLVNSKNCKPMVIRNDSVKYADTGELVRGTWLQTAHRNVDALRGKLASMGYVTIAGLLPIMPVFAMWGEFTVVGKPSADFVAGNVLSEYVRNFDSNRIATLSDSLISALESDMRRSTFWLG